MSTLKIIKLQSGAFEHIDSIDGAFFLGRFNFKQEFNKAFLVEAYGAKRRQYSITEIEVFDFGGTAETFTNWTDLINRLVDLGYTGIDTNSIPSGGGVWGSITGNIASQTDLQNELNTKLDKVTDADVERAYIVNADGTQGMKPTSDFGGGGDDYLIYNAPRAFIEFPNVGEWLCSNGGYVGPQFLGGTQVSCGAISDTTPNSTFNLQAVILPIPVGYIVHEILVNLNYKVYNTTNSTLEFFVQREETSGTGQVNTGSNAFTISNDTLVTTTGTTSNLRRIKSLAINAHTLPSLAFSYLQIAIRETQNASYNAISLQIKFKKV